MENNFFKDIKEEIGVFIIPALFLLQIIRQMKKLGIMDYVNVEAAGSI